MKPTRREFAAALGATALLPGGLWARALVEVEQDGEVSRDLALTLLDVQGVRGIYEDAEYLEELRAAPREGCDEYMHSDYNGAPWRQEQEAMQPPQVRRRRRRQRRQAGPSSTATYEWCIEREGACPILTRMVVCPYGVIGIQAKEGGYATSQVAPEPGPHTAICDPAGLLSIQS